MIVCKHGILCRVCVKWAPKLKTGITQPQGTFCNTYSQCPTLRLLCTGRAALARHHNAYARLHLHLTFKMMIGVSGHVLTPEADG
jgi:hypothetical protein